jgi:hypothetical protein
MAIQQRISEQTAENIPVSHVSMQICAAREFPNSSQTNEFQGRCDADEKKSDGMEGSHGKKNLQT